MKFTTTFLMALMAVFSMSCMVDGSDNSNNRQSTNNNIPTMAAPASNSNTSTAAAGTQHYVCPNGCAGSGGASEGSCPVCGTAYIHNASFHAQSQPQTTQPQLPASDPNAISPILLDRSKASTGTIDNTTSAATSTTATGGVQHYTCPNGCAGGGSSASGVCSVCGTTLAHNQAFHSQSSGSSNTVDLQTPTTNNSGVSHYICSNGCAGSGSNSSGNCSVCGQALTHNAAYHQ